MLKPEMETKLKERTEALEEARAAREDAIVEAWEQGGSLGEIAVLVHMSHMGISKMLERLGLRTPWRDQAVVERENAERRRAAAARRKRNA